MQEILSCSGSLISAYEEADFIARDIQYTRAPTVNTMYRDCAILYRTNAQSRMLEEQFVTVRYSL